MIFGESFGRARLLPIKPLASSMSCKMRKLAAMERFRATFLRPLWKLIGTLMVHDGSLLAAMVAVLVMRRLVAGKLAHSLIEALREVFWSRLATVPAWRARDLLLPLFILVPVFLAMP